MTLSRPGATILSLLVPSMHNTLSNRQKNLLPSVGCFGFLSRSRLLFPLCLDLFLCL